MTFGKLKTAVALIVAWMALAGAADAQLPASTAHTSQAGNSRPSAARMVVTAGCSRQSQHRSTSTSPRLRSVPAFETPLDTNEPMRSGALSDTKFIV